jgi:PAS domain S-box-containing protein
MDPLLRTGGGETKDTSMSPGPKVMVAPVNRVLDHKTSVPALASLPQATSTGERRLKLIIEAAPVSLMILDPSGHLLAANRAALSLFGVTRLDTIVGGSVGALIALEDRDRFTAFVARVCLGEPSSIDYTVVRPDGHRCAVETQGVVVRRADGDPAMFLGASWDVSARHHSAVALVELKAQFAVAESDRDALRTALEEARAAASSVDQLRALDRSQAEEATSRLQAALTDAEHRHARLANEWTADREKLMIRLTCGDDEKAALISELKAEQESRTTVLEAAERNYRQLLERSAEEHARLAREWAVERDILVARLARAEEETADLTTALGAERANRKKALEVAAGEYQQSLKAATEEHARVEQEWRSTRDRYEADILISRDERAQLSQAVQDMNKSYATLVSEHTAERAELEGTLRSERARCAELISERDEWRGDLEGILRALSDAGEQTQQLLNRCRNLRLVSINNQGNQVDVAEGGDTSAMAAATGTDQECSWQF